MNDFTIFEYGAGNSTLWWAARVSAIYVCEHDPEWYKIMENKVPAKVVLKQIDLTEAGKYCQEISQHKDKFNIIVVDGRDRNNCLRNCLPALTKDGVVILDNSERDSYKEGIDYLLQNGFRRIDFEGMGPVNPSAWSTSIFYKDGNCLGI
jgi:predicted O-methyltransferase YrrM